MYQYKKESTIILACIIIILVFYLILWCFKQLNKIELFSNSDSKREKMKKIYEAEKNKIKKTALNYAIIYYKNKSKDLTDIFTKEGIKLLEQYTFLRRELIKRDEQLVLATSRAIASESVVFELRQFISNNLDRALQIID